MRRAGVMPVPFYIEAREFFALGSFEEFRSIGPLSRQCLTLVVTPFCHPLYDATSWRNLVTRSSSQSWLPKEFPQFSMQTLLAACFKRLIRSVAESAA